MQEKINKIKACWSEISKLRREIDGILKNSKGVLTQKEKMVLRHRLVLQETFEEVGKHLGVTRERVRQVEAKGMEKLRAIPYGV